jgi:hypothetical protein
MVSTFTALLHSQNVAIACCSCVKKVRFFGEALFSDRLVLYEHPEAMVPQELEDAVLKLLQTTENFVCAAELAEVCLHKLMPPYIQDLLILHSKQRHTCILAADVYGQADIGCGQRG